MASEGSNPRRILLVRPSALGDVARTVPALVSLRRAYPDAKIDWLVRDSFADVIASHPDLSEVVPFPRQRFRGFGRSLGVTREVMGYIRGLRERRYDVVYDLQGLSRSGYLTWATRAPRRIGPADAREMAWLAYSNRISVPATLTHTVDRMMAVIEGDGVPGTVREMRLYVSEADRAWADAYLAQQNLMPERFAVIAPTARWLSKRWPIERFAAVADRLKALDFDAAVVVAAGAEREQVTPLLQVGGVRKLDLVGGTTVGQLMAIIERCGLVVANDSAALHIAVGLGRRCVGIYGPTDPRNVGPYRYDIGVIAADKEDRAHYRDVHDQSIIAGITVEQVYSGIKRVMSAAPPSLVHDVATHV